MPDGTDSLITSKNYGQKNSSVNKRDREKKSNSFSNGDQQKKITNEPDNYFFIVL